MVDVESGTIDKYVLDLNMAYHFFSVISPLFYFFTAIQKTKSIHRFVLYICTYSYIPILVGRQTDVGRSNISAVFDREED